VTEKSKRDRSLAISVVRLAIVLLRYEQNLVADND
jgi:hypothetical protein